MPVQRDLAAARADFPSLARKHGGQPYAYLDGPAGTQVPRSVIDAIAAYYTTCNANTHGRFATSRESDAVIGESRVATATLLGAADPATISFGANMTTLAFSLSHALARSLVPGDEILITQLDHEANRGPWLGLAERGIVVREAALRRDGTLDGDDLAAKITPRTRLVAVGMASNALGTVNDVARARTLARAVGAWLVLDAVHYAPHLPIDVQALDTDFLLCSAYKFYGPHVGILYTRPGLLERIETDRLRTQEEEAPERIETGTLNHAALAGVTAAVRYIAAWGEGADLRSRLVSAMHRIGAHEHGLARFYHDRVRQIPGVTVWGPDFSSDLRAPTVSITIAGVDSGDAAAFLGERGIAVWDGHFYAARTVEVLGLVEQGGLLRTGMSLYNTIDEVERLLAGIADLARRGA